MTTVCVVYLLLAAGARLLPLLPAGQQLVDSLPALPRADDGALKGAAGVPVLLATAFLLLSAYTVLRTRATITREGLVCSSAWQTRRLGRPTSRSSFFVTASRSPGRTTAVVCVLAPDGTAWS